ncbi:hypothetical protein G6F37_007038 [Rhizopus arrhizus]|nr:hypothetical protein G6F38_007177 [Rhizopus arrhizus]KAG1157068.1 hypothetical protein G6F37_007038 [Rhizopus arrhizus]
MVLSAKNHAQHLNPAKAGKRATPKTTWRKIVTRDIVSLKHSTPTSAAVPPTLSRRNSSLSSTSDFNLNDAELGITLPDNAFVKGYKSLPAEAQIVRLKLERLPFKPVSILTKEMEHRLSNFGNVLDLGIIRSDGRLTGVVYVTLDINPAANKGNHLRALQRIIQWDDEIRQVYIQWDEVPPFCRLCQSHEYCQTDCPDLKKFVEHYH